MADGNRKSAYRVLWNVQQKGAYSQLALNSVLKQEKPDAPALVRELVYGVLEEQMLLDHTIARYLKQPFARLGAAEKILLRMGFWQLDFAEKIPPFAAVNETVNLTKAVAPGREGLINAVLRAFVREEEPVPKSIALLQKENLQRDAYLSVAYSAAPWIVETWQADYGSERTEQLLKASHETPDLVLRPNRCRLKGSRQFAEALQPLLPEGVILTPGTVCESALHAAGTGILDTEAFRQGYFSVQDEASQYAVEVLNPQPGDTVYDLCAAPGGKTLAIAERMQESACESGASQTGWGKLIACDIHEGKLKTIAEEAKRLGLEAPQLLVRNAAEPDADPLLPESADRVLVDAPCSGLGVLRRKPEIKLRERDPHWEDLPPKQQRILQKSASLVKPGGVLVYSTCTVRKAENENVIEAFLQANPAFVKETERQLFPGEAGTDGFYICRMKRRKDNP